MVFRPSHHVFDNMRATYYTYLFMRLNVSPIRYRLCIPASESLVYVMSIGPRGHVSRTSSSSSSSTPVIFFFIPWANWSIAYEWFHL